MFGTNPGSWPGQGRVLNWMVRDRVLIHVLSCQTCVRVSRGMT
ncbi:hypothetical protein M6B38_317605 [Iris pallida]|uniref:Uncharacterized protein n=1 Tax=Iris pallida TaxID=29817 RepID=A0AAX6HDS6_IRIPA|nr:hypothetical protein M6B38_317605 [Iris pallida]